MSKRKVSDNFPAMLALRVQGYREEQGSILPNREQRRHIARQEKKLGYTLDIVNLQYLPISR